MSNESHDYDDDFDDALNAADRGDYKTAYKLWLPLAELGDAEAQHLLGLMYYEGQGDPQEYKEAVKWFRLSAEQGDNEAQCHLGVSYSEGQGVEQDYNEALKWYLLSGEQGYS